jgi:hypothetical protein
MSLYDPERDPVRRAGRWLRWSVAWLAMPAALGVFISGNIDIRSLPLVGAERESAVILLDGQAYFGHLDDSGESGTLVLRDAYYFADAKGGPTSLPVGLVKRGGEAHQPADGMRINREKVLAVEQVGLTSPVAQAIQVERDLGHVAPPVSLNRQSVAGAQTLAIQRVAAEHDLQRGYASATDQLVKLNDLVLPVSKADAQSITLKAQADLRTVRRDALSAMGKALGMSPAEAQAYAIATDAKLEGQTFANEAGVLLAPDLNGIVNQASQIYAQVEATYAKQLTQPRTASPSPSPSARP